SGRYRFGEINAVEIATRETFLDANTPTLSELRKNLSTALEDPRGSNRHVSSPLESVRLLVSLSSSNTVNGVLIFPRDKGFETRYGAKYVTAKDSEIISPKNLRSFIQLNATNLVAF